MFLCDPGREKQGAAALGRNKALPPRNLAQIGGANSIRFARAQPPIAPPPTPTKHHGHHHRHPALADTDTEEGLRALVATACTKPDGTPWSQMAWPLHAAEP